MPDVPKAIVPPLSEAGWLKITPAVVTVPLTLSSKPEVLKVAVLPSPVVASQLLPVTPVQFVAELSQVPPVTSPDQVPFWALTGDENTNAKLMKAGNAFRMVLILLFMSFYPMVLWLLCCYLILLARAQQLACCWDRLCRLGFGHEKSRLHLCHTLCLLIYEIGQFFKKPKIPSAFCRGG